MTGANWLTVSPTSGTGSGAIRITVNAAGLSRGAYAGLVSVQSDDALPQVIHIPVTFVVGASETTVVTAIANGASYAQAFAPGMLMTVFGTQLSPVTRSAVAVPLPLDIAGVSATVNGVSAPLYYVSPGQINVQVPYETGAGLAVLGVNNNGQVASFPFTVAPAAPGLFTTADGSLTPSASARQGQTGGRVHHRRRRHHYVPDHGRESAERHRDLPSAAAQSPGKRHGGRTAGHGFLRRNADRAGRHLAD